jgi:hypothetical protein
LTWSVDVNDRPFLVALAAIALAATASRSPPHLCLHLIDGVSQSGQLVLYLVEAAQEVARRRRIWDPARTDDPPHGLAVLQVRDVFDTGPAGVQVEHLGEHVIGLAIATVHAEDRDVPVDALGELEAMEEFGRHSQAAIRSARR